VKVYGPCHNDPHLLKRLRSWPWSYWSSSEQFIRSERCEPILFGYLNFSVYLIARRAERLSKKTIFTKDAKREIAEARSMKT
jgi:hypothetical protein